METIKEKLYPRKSTNQNEQNGKQNMAVMNIHNGIGTITKYDKMADKKISQYTLQTS
jgi:hypothetical protein